MLPCPVKSSELMFQPTVCTLPHHMYQSIFTFDSLTTEKKVKKVTHAIKFLYCYELPYTLKLLQVPR